MNYEKHEKDGHIYYLVPELEFLRLQEQVESERDVKDFDKAITEATEFFPQYILDAMLNGNNPIVIFRKYRELTQEQLAEKTSLSRAYIAQIETRKKTGSIDTIKKIADALNVDIELIIA